MKDKMRRFGWLMLVLLFVITGLGVGVYGFWQATHQSNQDQTQTTPKTTSLKGTKMKNFTPLSSIDKLQAIDTKEGTGKTVHAGDTVSVMYTGAVAATGVIFDSNTDTGQPLTISLSGVIAGWTDGLPGMKVGGTRRLLIPSAAGYGATGQPAAGIPANADLVFDVTLLDTQPPK